jgi:hypothetical protein
MRNTVLALVIAAMATPAYAQFTPNLAGGSVGLHPKTEADVRKEKEREDGYRAGVSKIPDSKGKQDPWSGVRSAAPAPGQNAARSNSK